MDAFGVYTEVMIRWMERLAAGKAMFDPGRWKPDDGFCVRR